MKKRLGESLKAIGTMLSNWKYLLLTMIIAAIFFAGNIYAPNLRILLSYSGKPGLLFSLLKDLFIGGVSNLPIHTLVIMILIAILTGMVISLITMKVRMKIKFKEHAGKKATIGIVLGLFAPACASCGLGLISIVGLGSVLAYLPFKGIEIGILSVILLAYATYSLSSSMRECKECRI